MKKIMYLAAALLVLVGCNKNSQENKENAPANYGTITGTIELPQGPNKIAAPDGWKAMTEAFKMQWENTDKIYIYNETECKELTVKSIDTQTGNATFEGELLDNMSSYNVAYGYNPMAGATAFAVDYIADNYRPFASGTGEYYVFTIDNFGPVMGLKLKGTAKVDKIEVIASKSSAAQATYTMTLATAIELNATTPTVVYFPLNQLGDADKLEAKFYQGSTLAKTQTFVTLPAKNIVTTYPAIEVNDPDKGHAYVDLGLSVKWATTNVGATTPEGYGNYFAWGETSPKEVYDWSTYFDSNNGETFTKYYHGGGKTTLDPEDDAAHVNWGGDWRMPTFDETYELQNNCTFDWKENYNGTGVNGHLVTSKKNGNSIFLPAAGYYYEGSSLLWVGECGYYWSSSLDEYESNSASNIYFFPTSFGARNDRLRSCGLPVRPVCE